MKKLFLKIVVVSIAVALVHVGLFVMAGQPGIPLMMDDLDMISAEGADVVYLGDSCVLDHAPDDIDTRSLPEILDEKMPEHRVVSAAHNAYHGELFSGMCRVMAKGTKRPKVVIIPINLRSFSMSWDQKPEYQFPKMDYLLENDHVWQRSAMRPLIAFNYIDLIPITQDEFEAMPVEIDGREDGTVGDYERPPEVGEDMDAYFRRQFRYIYGYTLISKHRKLQGILRAVEILQENGIEPIVYVTPIDHEGVMKFSGEELMERVRANIGVVREVLAETGVTVHDFSEALGSESFCYEYAIHEHLDEGGRDFVAEEIARSVLELLADSIED